MDPQIEEKSHQNLNEKVDENQEEDVTNKTDNDNVDNDDDKDDDNDDDDDGEDNDEDGTTTVCDEELSDNRQGSRATVDQEQEWRDAFYMFDKDHNGTIEFEELATIMRLLGGNPTDADVNAMMKELDTDNNGTIDLEEFLEMMAKHAKDPVDEEAELIEAFQVFDRNNDGFVDSTEIKYVMNSLGQNLTDAEIDELIAIGEQESDEKGKLDYKGFIKVMQRGDS